MADTITNFCLITIYLSEWGLSRVRSTTLALDNSQADRYYLASRMIHEPFKIRKKRGIYLWN